ncbi:MAG: hypothetical protein CME31_17530 [Gimesia sp.]|jgi:hypothetical protein|nr:hypothetical protein [Gimesia sp.]|tara:strand:+ start:268 stop:468 length:201 start_codon:yes stop_codon:yes gene_type:complete
MAEVIKELLEFSIKEQEIALKSLSNDCNPIEINGEVFIIPKEVNELIDNLFLQLQDLKFGKEINKG